MKQLVLVALFFGLLAAPAEARHRQVSYTVHPDCNVLWPCEGVTTSPRGERVVRAMGGFGTAKKIYTPNITQRERKTRIAAVYVPASRPAGIGLAGVTPQLASKVTDIVSTCGSQVISAVRHTFIAGTRHISQHANGTAVDVTGNPSCIYSMLHDWPGGYSIDYARMKHVHISIGGPENGLRFVHGGGHRHYAHQRHRRYASR